MVKQFISRLFKTKRTSVRNQPTNDSVSPTELQEMILDTSNRVRGLNSTVKQYAAMEDAVDKTRKKHYAKLKNAAKILLERETIELNTLLLFERGFIT